jgi:hypothetical protein
MWLDEVGFQLLAIEDDHEDQRAAKIAKKKQDKGRRRPGKEKAREGEGPGRCIRRVCTSYSIRISKPSKVGKQWLSCGSLQHVRNLLNGATLEKHSHLDTMKFIENTM